MALAYLLSPTFEFVNTAGKPVTGGHLEVYISGTRDKYYCASDFDGTLHPFRIPLDSLGANVVLAEEGKTYDVYCYNRYGGLLMSRYGVKPGAGGGSSVDSITSTDGSIIVTETANGVDLSVNSEPPTSMRCSGEDLLVDGTFQFSELERDGLNASVYNHNVLLNKGWWHYDATVRLQWNGSSNVTTPVQLYSAGSSDSMEFDLSFAHSETVQVSGEQKVNADGTQFVLGVTGIPTGMRVSLVDFGIHSITGEGAGGKYNAGTGIDIDEPNRVISVDTDTIQEKLTPGNGITIDGNNEISVDTTVVATQADLATKQDVISDLSDIRAGAAAGATAVQDADYVHTDNNFTDADVTKLSGIEAGAEVNVQANWNESDSSSDSFILNKPTIPSGSQLVPSATPSDAGEVLTVDSNGDPTWAPAQAPISAGDGIDITNNVVSVDLDGTSLTNGANGLSVTLPVPDTTGASQGDVLSVGQSGIEWTTPSGGGGDDAVLTYNVSTWSDFTTAYNAGKNIRVVETVNDTTYEAVLFEYNPNGSPQGYAKFTATTLRTGVDAVSSNWYQISNIDSGVWTRGAGTIQGNYSGQGAISINSSSHGISLTLDGSSLTQSSSGLAVANPLPSTLGTAGQVLQVNSGATGVEWATPSGGGSVTDVEVNGTSVVNASGVAEVTVPAQVNADWNAVSGVAEILNKPSIPVIGTITL